MDVLLSLKTKSKTKKRNF